jgi:hypothetical protein
LGENKVFLGGFLAEPDDITRIENKIKLSLLKAEKRLVNLEVDLSELKEKLKSIDLDEVQNLKQKVEDIEDLIMVENAGVVELKKMMEDIGTKLEKAPSTQPVPDFNALSNKVNTIKGSVDELTKKKLDLEMKIAEIEKKFEIMKSEEGEPVSEYFLEEFKKNKGKIVEIENKISSLENSIKKFENLEKVSLGKEIEDNVRKIKFVEEMAKELSERVGSIYNKIDKRLEKVKNVDKDFYEIKRSISNLKGEIDRNRKEILKGWKREDFEKISSRIDEIEVKAQGLLGKGKEEFQKLMEEKIKEVAGEKTEVKSIPEFSGLLDRIISLESRIGALERVIQDKSGAKPIVLE